MEIEAMEQFELERLDNILRIMSKVERACKDGYLFEREELDLKYECGLTKEKCNGQNS